LIRYNHVAGNYAAQNSNHIPAGTGVTGANSFSAIVVTSQW